MLAVSTSSFWIVYSSSEDTIHNSKRISELLPSSPAPEPKSKQLVTTASHLPLRIHDDLCTDCRFALAGSHPNSNTCQWRLLRLLQLQQSNTTTATTTTQQTNNLTQAAQFLAQEERPDFCSRCDPAACPDHEKVYWRLDAAAPRTVSAVTHYLRHAIPPSHRLPASFNGRNHNYNDNSHDISLQDYISDPRNVFPQKIHLFEFNPSIVQLPVDQIPPDLPNAVYLASFRVSNAHNCLAEPGLRAESSKKSAVLDYLGLALLDTNLQILREVVIDAAQTMRRLQDARLFVLKDQIFVASYDRIHPNWIGAPPFNNYNHENTTAMNDFLTIHDSIFMNDTTTANNTVTQHSMKVYFRTAGSCTTDRRTQRGGKNLNYFVDAHNRTILELQPMGLKEHMDLQAHCEKSSQPLANPIVADSTQKLPNPSFGTTDEIEFWQKEWKGKLPYTGDRGGACCIHTNYNGQPLLIGIAHSKTRFKHSRRGTDEASKQKGGIEPNHFLSSFYAMQAVAPYKVVARTGNFCLGFSQASELHVNPYALLQKEALHIQQVRYDDKCPRIHFVSGMVEKADDPSKLIISYGLNDCTPRMIVVEKQDVLTMLFKPEQIQRESVW